jgi:hypothetical protein
MAIHTSIHSQLTSIQSATDTSGFVVQVVRSDDSVLNYLNTTQDGLTAIATPLMGALRYSDLRMAEYAAKAFTSGLHPDYRLQAVSFAEAKAERIATLTEMLAH